MIMLWIILVFIYIIINVCIAGLAIERIISYEGLLNPVEIYRDYDVNVFGAILLMLLGSLLCLPAVPFFWIYKLSTVGRNK